MNQIQKKILLIFFITFHNFINSMHIAAEPRIAPKKTVQFEKTPTSHETNSSTHTTRPELIDAIRSQEKMQPKIATYQEVKTPVSILKKTNKPFEQDSQSKNTETKQSAKKNPTSLDLWTENTEKRQEQKDSLSFPTSRDYLHREQMEAPLESYVQKINSEITTSFPFIKNILPQEFFKSFSIMYIVDQSSAFLGYKKVILDNVSLENIDWHTSSPSSVQKFAAGLSELQIVSKKSRILQYNPQFKDPKSMTTMIANYIFELQKNPLFQNQPSIILQQYVLAILKESRSGQPGLLWGSEPILKPEDVSVYIPQKKEAWPTEKNSEGDYIGKPSPSQKIYAMMEAIHDIPLQATKITSEEIQLSRYGQALDAISNIPTQMGKYIQSSAYNIAMSQLEKQVSPELYNKIVLIFESQNPVDTAKKIALQEILNRDHSTNQGESFLDQHDLELLRQIAQQEASHFITTTGPNLAQGIREQNLTYSREQQPLLNKQAQDIFDEITSAALDRGAEILMSTLFTPDEIAKIELNARNQELAIQDRQISEDMIKNYLELKKIENNEQLNEQLIKKSFNRLSRSPITLYFIDSFQASAQKIGKSKEALKYFVSSIVTSFSRLKGLTIQEEAILQEAGIEETNNLLNSKDSWLNTTKSEFHEKFAVWIETFTTKMYQWIGKTNPKDLHSLDFNSQENPLTPKVNVIWNDKEVDPAKKVTSILVTYKDVTMKFDHKDNSIIFDKNKETYTIATELTIKTNAKTIKESISTAISEGIINGVLIEPLVSGTQGNTAAQQEVKALNDALTSQGQGKEGVLIIQYDPKKEQLTTTVAKKNENGQVSKIVKEYSTEHQELLSQRIILSPKSSEGLLGSVDTYTPDIIIEDPSPKRIDPTKAGLSFKAEYKHPQTGEVYIFDAQQKDISVDESGTYKITGTLNTRQQAPPLPDGIEGQIIKIMQKIVGPLNVKAYRSTVSGFRDTWTGVRIAQQYPQLYKAAEQWMLNNYETGVESIEIEYNPAHNIVATKVFSTMALGGIQGKKSYYPLN